MIDDARTPARRRAPSEQAWSKLRRQVHGWECEARQLIAAGAAPPRAALPVARMVRR